MKETTKMSRIAGYLEGIYRHINLDSFGGMLDTPVITIQSTPGAYGHVSVHRTWKRKDDWAHELNISADWLTRPIEEVVATMIHEMVHIYNLQNNIQDCSRGGTYHNRKFKEEAEKHMLQIEKHDKYGWTITKPTDELLEYIMDKGWGEILTGKNPLYGLLGTSGGTSGRGGAAPTEGGKEPRKGNSRRYQCPMCKGIVRTTKDMHIICGDCGVDFELTN